MHCDCVPTYLHPDYFTEMESYITRPLVVNCVIQVTLTFLKGVSSKRCTNVLKFVNADTQDRSKIVSLVKFLVINLTKICLHYEHVIYKTS